jgi:hypothetical protein
MVRRACAGENRLWDATTVRRLPLRLQVRRSVHREQAVSRRMSFFPSIIARRTQSYLQSGAPT